MKSKSHPRTNPGQSRNTRSAESCAACEVSGVWARTQLAEAESSANPSRAGAGTTSRTVVRIATENGSGVENAPISSKHRARDAARPRGGDRHGGRGLSTARPYQQGFIRQFAMIVLTR